MSTASLTPSGTSSPRRRRWKRRGRRVRYLNIGDPVAFGFKTPPHLDRRRRARDARRPQRLRAVGGHRGGARGGRRGIHGARLSGVRRSRLHHGGHVRRHRARAERARRRAATTCSCRCRPIRSTRRSSRRSARSALFYRTDPARGWMPDLDDLAQPRHAGDARAGRHRPEQPDRRHVSRPRRGARCSTSPSGTGCRSSPTRSTATSATTAPSPPLGSLDPDAPIISFSSLSKAYLAPGWRTGWMAVGRSPRLDDVAGGDEEAGGRRLCSTVPMQYAIDGGADRRPIAPGRRSARRCSARADADARALDRDARASRAWRRTAALLRDAEGRAAAGTHRRGLRAGAAARDRRAVRLRLGLRHAGRRRVLPRRVPGAARRARRRSTT